MNIEEYRTFCISKPGVSEAFPFDEKTLVFKVMGKMFALCGVDDFLTINLKCDPDEAIRLREEYEGVKPGYHMSKTHWNTVVTDGTIGDRDLYEWITNSYNLVVEGLPKKAKLALANLS